MRRLVWDFFLHSLNILEILSLPNFCLHIEQCWNSFGVLEQKDTGSLGSPGMDDEEMVVFSVNEHLEFMELHLGMD